MEPGFILDTPLPVTQNFKLLKEEALAFIQAFGGYEWTNLNTSDPGVTIVDQLCYALTELGYCTDFSIKDILTRSDGKLTLKNQFYLPEQILTTSPVSLEDYRKYLIDRIPNLRNVMLYACNSTFYQVYFDAKNNDGALLHQELADEIFYTLNECRNLNELFLQPKAFEDIVLKLSGNLEVEQENKVPSILVAIHTAIENCIFPAVKQAGYDTLMAEGLQVNEIFNGPLLQNGWISTNALGSLTNKITINEIAAIILAVPGVEGVSLLTFGNALPPLPVKPSQLLRIDLSGLYINCKGKNLSYNLAAVLNRSSLPQTDVVLGAAVDIQTQVPEGKYRDINAYYSIQHTFPEIFGVGESGLTSNATPFQIAQSRQLKGYLTLFDQVLANQFSQLANLDKLFSFKNSMNGNPSDVHTYYAVQDEAEKKHQASPVPYLAFSPTYYFQSVYQVPHVQPLLKDPDMFKLMEGEETEKELEQDSWMKYRQNPYNPYIRGLMEIMQDEQVDLSRRNDILDHLLARHGESPLIIDAITEGTVYTGSRLKDQVIFKSLYLENLGILSYYRHKAYNFLAATKLKDLNAEPDHAFFSNDTRDFVFMAEEVDHEENLKAADFINYAAVELKLCLLFGLKMQYKNYLIHHYGESLMAELNPEIQTALWLIQQRKGLIFIELNVLWQHLSFHITIKTGLLYWLLDVDLTFRQLIEIHDFIAQNDELSIQYEPNSTTCHVGDSIYNLKQVVPINDAQIRDQLAIVSISLKDGYSLSVSEFDLLFSNKVILVFPAFLIGNAFINRLDIFLKQSLPVSTTYAYYFEEPEPLQLFITTFIAWHNSLIFNPAQSSDACPLAAVDMAQALLKLNSRLG
ncbi:hypothetical protein G6M26_21040 [Agrobacterium tumefaciens]|nr:hypothetical protein [Agrobacterium tumefaciens]NTE21025.1 hypothetical protein [Agrobacterium tumefaciens]